MDSWKYLEIGDLIIEGDEVRFSDSKDKWFPSCFAGLLFKEPIYSYRRRKTIYIAGPMRGIKRYNADAFNAAEVFLKEKGFKVINPVQLDRDRGFDVEGLPEDYDWSTFCSELHLEEVIKEDVEHVLKSDAIYMLDGWEHSSGACAELSIAGWANKEFFYQSELGCDNPEEEEVAPKDDWVEMAKNLKEKLVVLPNGYKPQNIHSGNKYHRQIQGFGGTIATVDVYRILEAFDVVEPGLQHAIKKLLCAGIRGKGDLKQDLSEAVDAVQATITKLGELDENI